MSRRSSRIATAILAPSASISATTFATIPAEVATKKTNNLSKKTKTSTTDNKENHDIHDDQDAGATVASKKRRKVAKEDTEVTILGDGKTRCVWANNPRYPLLQTYHDEEWNCPGGYNHSNRYLFELLILEGAQAGLSWSTVLHKREAYRDAYHQFDYHRIATTYTSPKDNDRLLQTDIVKNKLKVQASMVNANAFVELLKELYPDQTKPEDTKGFWVFLQDYKKKDGGKKGQKDPIEYLTRSPESDRLSEDLKKRGFKFVGTTIMYAYLQAAGIEQDGIQHTKGCFRHHMN
ncbi:hypothetical protein FBU30_001058 [Linnemannia zychae]|nr:hypothetical protein FBU30_001058 [Linnemannia zychae]